MYENYKRNDPRMWFFRTWIGKALVYLIAILFVLLVIKEITGFDLLGKIQSWF